MTGLATNIHANQCGHDNRFDCAPHTHPLHKASIVPRNVEGRVLLLQFLITHQQIRLNLTSSKTRSTESARHSCGLLVLIPRFFLMPEGQHIHGVGGRLVAIQRDVAGIPKTNY